MSPSADGRDVRTRADLAAFLQDSIAGSYSRIQRRQLEWEEGLLKTFCVEANVGADTGTAHDGIGAFLRATGENAGFQVANLDDELFYRLESPTGHDSDDLFFVDATDPRFWVIYTLVVAARSDTFIERRLVATAALDYAWFPVQFLRKVEELGMLVGFGINYNEGPVGVIDEPDALIMRLRGTIAAQAHEILATAEEFRQYFALSSVRIRMYEDESALADEVFYWGKVTSVGNSFAIHSAVVSSLYRQMYRQTLEETIETKRVGFDDEGRGLASFSGEPMILALSRGIEDIPRFLTGVFSGRKPFRLWGAPIHVKDDTYRVQAVDLHTNDRVSFEVRGDAIHLFLPMGSCGNTAARFTTLVQRHFDGAAVLISTDGASVF